MVVDPVVDPVVVGIVEPGVAGLDMVPAHMAAMLEVLVHDEADVVPNGFMAAMIEEDTAEAVAEMAAPPPPTDDEPVPADRVEMMGVAVSFHTHGDRQITQLDVTGLQGMQETMIFSELHSPGGVRRVLLVTGNGNWLARAAAYQRDGVVGRRQIAAIVSDAGGFRAYSTSCYFDTALDRWVACPWP